MEPIRIIRQKNIMTVLLLVDIDHHSSAIIRKVIDDTFSKYHPKKLVLDFSSVAFMDSSGVGLIMGRYRLAHAENAELSISGLNERCRKLIKLSGITQLVKI